MTVLQALGGYLVLVNAFAVGLFAYDKYQAKSGGWRVPEAQLQLSALLGGWMGGLWAMETFRHKTVKKSFRDGYKLCVVANVVGMSLITVGYFMNGPFRNQVIRFSQQLRHSLKKPF